jgi:poly(3-hydroxybutyrate) depolymerase
MVAVAHRFSFALVLSLGLGLALGACGSSAGDPAATPAAGSSGSASGAPGAGDASDSDSDAGAAAGDGSSLPAASRCQASPAEVTCTHQQASLIARDVFYEVPLGTPPAKGWPLAFFFQGSFVPAAGAFTAKKDDAFGLYRLTLTIKELLDHGYAVLAPNASVAGHTAWETNVPPWSDLWSTSADDAFMKAIFTAVAGGTFGAVDASRLYAMGISSGGFMTSRMAVSYAGKFRALAVHSGGYATCGTTCTLPATQPVDHPPTLFLHGGADTTVKPTTMTMYRDQLAAEGHTVKTVLDPAAGHEWLVAGPTEIRAWFDANP